MFNILLLFALIGVNAFFAASEIALITLNDNKIKTQAGEGDKKSKKLLDLLSEPGRFLATIQVGITLAGFLASASASQSFADDLAKFAIKIGVPLPQSLLGGIAVVIITLILSYFTLVLGELVPKRLAMQHAEKISNIAVGPLTLISKLTAPIVTFLNSSTNFFIRLTGSNPNDGEEELTEEEIRMMIDVGEEKGAIMGIEKELINNIFEFNDKVASDIMTHRTEIVAFDLATDKREIFKIFADRKYTRMPVYDEVIDHIVGILHIKDILGLIHDEEGDFELTKLMKKPVFVPESKPLDELFREMQRGKVHMVVVIDEYGGTAGIVTIEDLIEEIVGNIFDEYDEMEFEYQKISDNIHYFNGGIDLDKVAYIMQIDLPSKDYDTLSGYLIGVLGKIPRNGEVFEIKRDGVIYRIKKVERKRIVEVEIEKPETLESENEENE
ncbi:hemolysin family protein [Alkalibacter mobilis]|uniref:hemolysin family protein n=1 Tax=Alkalibacter mobilis TaxID=2787712 RepID=UPI00189E0AEA|nr:hemolysin family protein [Alkalibacter mobilis]MBF7096357.1 HlyC/CorC family transporter [Alkalibacter mobilis]